VILRTSPAHEEGGRRGFSVETVAFSGCAGQVDTLHFRQLRPAPGQNGRRTLEPVPESESELRADLVLLALGFTGAMADEIASDLGLGVLPGGRLTGRPTGETDTPHVFAFGDAVRGATLVVQAIADGRSGAAAIDAGLRARTG
jgi:glutamate synthase (NADPH/NADH) small chain